MDDRLQRLTRELRSEKCPPHVLAKVQERIACEQKSPFAGFGFPALAGLAVVLMLAVIVGVFQLTRELKPVPTPVQQARVSTSDPARVAAEAKLSLACIGHILLEAAHHSESVVLEKAIPPLTSGFKTVQTTLKTPTAL